MIEPSDELNYAEYRYLGTHNSHVYPPYFEIIKNQNCSIIDQLNAGVRGLMIDTYAWELAGCYTKEGNGAAVLSHGKPGDILTTIQKARLTYPTLRQEMVNIINWMKTHTNAIVTVIIEDYTSGDKDIKNAIADANYDPIYRYHKDGPWPTLGEMRKNNARMMIFTQRGASTDVTWSQFTFCVENKYNTLDSAELYQERDESAAKASLYRQIIIFNHFAAFSLACFSYKQLKYTVARDIITYCKNQGFAGGKLPNGYFVDYAVLGLDTVHSKNKDTVIDYFNELNQVPEKVTATETI